MYFSKKIEYVNSIFFLIAIIMMLTFTQVSIFSDKIIYFFIFFLFLVFSQCEWSRSFIDRNLLFFLMLYISSISIGIFSLPFAFIYEIDKFDYNKLKILGRLINIFFNVYLIVFIDSYLKNRDVSFPFKWYKIGLFILMISACWHLLSFYLPFVNFPFETRDHLHSVYGQNFSFSKRVTGFSSEPSYFVMFAIDFLILSLIFDSKIKRKMNITLSIILIIFSLSPSGYVTLIGSFFMSIIFVLFKYKKKYVLFSVRLILILILISIYIYKFSDLVFFKYVVSRIVNVDINSSSRLYMLIKPFEWSQASNLFIFLFGHGFKSFSIIGTCYKLPSGEPIHTTSNNIFVDLFWESGFVGLLFLLCFFIWVFIRIMKSKVSKEQLFFLLLVFFNLIFSSLFRADFTSLRFFLMLYLLFILLTNDLKTIRTCAWKR